MQACFMVQREATQGFPPEALSCSCMLAPVSPSSMPACAADTHMGHSGSSANPYTPSPSHEQVYGQGGHVTQGVCHALTVGAVGAPQPGLVGLLKRPVSQSSFPWQPGGCLSSEPLCQHAWPCYLYRSHLNSSLQNLSHMLAPLSQSWCAFWTHTSRPPLGMISALL